VNLQNLVNFRPEYILGFTTYALERAFGEDVVVVVIYFAVGHIL